MAIIVTNGRITAFNWVLSPIGIAGAQFITAYGVATLASSLGAPWFAIDLDKVADLNSGSIGNVLPLLIAFLPLLLYDFFYYWFHRFQHANSWLWEQHKLHQSDQSLNVMTTYRHNWLEQFFKSLLVALSHSSRSSRDGGVIRHCDIRALWSAPLAVDRLQVWNWPELPGFQRMKPMAKHRPHSIEFKRQVALEFIAGETLHALSSRHDVSRNPIRIWVRKFEAGAFDDDARAADLLQDYEAKIAALERMVGRYILARFDPCRNR